MTAIFMALAIAFSGLLPGSHVRLLHSRKVHHCVNKNNQG